MKRRLGLGLGLSGATGDILAQIDAVQAKEGEAGRGLDGDHVNVTEVKVEGSGSGSGYDEPMGAKNIKMSEDEEL